MQIIIIFGTRAQRTAMCIMRRMHNLFADSLRIRNVAKQRMGKMQAMRTGNSFYLFLFVINLALSLSLSFSFSALLFEQLLRNCSFCIFLPRLLRSSLCAPLCHIVFRALYACVCVCVTVAFKGSQRERTHSPRPTTADTIHIRSEQQQQRQHSVEHSLTLNM